MKNYQLWWNQEGDRHRPILMICYTNHALDQFLESCVEKCGLSDGVVRVGGQSRSDKMNNFKLASVKQMMRRNGRINRSILYQMKNERTTQMKLQSMLEFKIQTVQSVLNRIGLLRFNLET